MGGGANGEVVFVQPEIDLVTRFDTELIAQLLGNNDLPLGADAMSHTTRYNSGVGSRPTVRQINIVHLSQ